MVKSTSKRYSLNWRDVVKGAVVATLTPCVVLLQNSLDAGTLAFNYKQLAMAAIGGGLAYLLKNWLTDSSNK